MVQRIRPFLFLLLLVTAVWPVFAGGGPQNVLVVMNARSGESLEIGNAYRRARDIPYRNVLVLDTATTFSVAYQTYLDEIETPIRAYLKHQQLEDEITQIVLTRGVPQRVAHENGRAVASLLAAMGLGANGASSPNRLRNPYLNAPMAFTPRPTTLRGMYLVTVLQGFHTGDIQQLISQGVTADGTAPDGRFLLQASPQIPPAANKAAANLLAMRGYAVEAVNAPPADLTGLMAYLSGGAFSGISKDTVMASSFRPGALADLAQNFSAAENNFDETAPPVLLPVSWFVRAGATGVHGVIGDASFSTLPLVGNQAVLLDRYTSGFSLAESFYAALPVLNWQNLVIGDPLCTPYAQRPTVTVELEPRPLTGLVPIRVTATSPVAGTSIGRVDVLVDDRAPQTIYAPSKCTVALRIGETTVRYDLPSGATVRTLLDGLAEAINTDARLSGPTGVRAVPVLKTSTLQLLARAPGEDGNKIAATVTVENERPTAPAVTARLERALLAGGGLGPVPAKGTVSFLGRRIKPGDEITLQIQQEKLTYIVPEDKATLSGILDGLAELVEKSPILQRPSGVRAVRDPNGMPYLILQARTPGERGNAMVFRVSVKAVEGSQLRAYPDTPSLFKDGHDGSAASVNCLFTLGESTARGTLLLDTTNLADGYHRLRVVAYDGSPAQVQGSKTLAFQVANLPTAPRVTLPDRLGPVSGEVTVPVTAGAEVTRVDVYVDGQLLGSATEAPFAPRLPLTALGRGRHDLWAEAFDAAGESYLTAPIPLEVIVASEVARVVPNHTAQVGGTVHRIIGSGFQPKCQVRLAGVLAQSVTVISPNVLEVTADPGPARRGWVEITNPDGTVGTLANAFEYYVPRVAAATVLPVRDVVQPGYSARFTASCLDQYDHPLQATLTWTTTGGSINGNGVYTAPKLPGTYRITASHPDSPKRWESEVIVGPAEVKDGRLRHWLVLGPFPDPQYTALETPLIEETRLLPFHGAIAADRSWQSVISPSDYVDFAAALSPNANAVAYAHVYLFAPAHTEAALVCGSDDGMRLWLNGELLHTARIRRAPDPNQTTLPIVLAQGWNRLLMKVDQGDGGWGFFLRLTTRDNKPLTGLSYLLDRPDGLALPELPKPEPAPPAEPEKPAEPAPATAAPAATEPQPAAPAPTPEAAPAAEVKPE